MAGRRTRRHERGAIAIVVAVSMTLVTVIAALVLDFGLVRVDRQVDKSAADAAVLAGLQGLMSDQSTSELPYTGVCTAIRFLKVNNPRFSGLDENLGWSDGLGAPKASGCTDTTLRRAKCVPGNQASWARYDWSGASGGLTLTVRIQSGYQLAGSGFAEDSLAASTSDPGDPTRQGCDQLSVIVTQARRPGLGSLATSSDLQTSIRSVGRVKPGPGRYAPAMLLLKRTGCPVLQTGSNGGQSFIHVLGSIGSNGIAQPGTIHADTDGTNCTGGSNQSIFLGRAANGIVAYAAPLATNPAVADPTKPGSITSVASNAGITGTVIRDTLSNAYASSALNGSGGTQYEPSGRMQVTRRSIDERYLGGVRAAVTAASGVFASNPNSNGWVTLNDCSPTQAAVNALGLTSSSKLYLKCNANAGFVPGALNIVAGEVWFQNFVAPSGSVTLPNAHHVYIENVNNKTHALDLTGNGAEFQVHTAGNTDGSGNCSTGQSASKAILFIRSGDFKESNANRLLRLCRTTVVMMGGYASGCLPSTTGTAPTSTPCGTSVANPSGNGLISQTGGNIDWTAPDRYDVTTLPDGSPDPAIMPAWSDPDGPEDLALWTESYGDASSSTFSMGGGGTFNVRGVFMVPNADPFTIGGGASMTLTNAQFIATSIWLNGSNTNITMSVDPNSAVQIDQLRPIGLVR